MTCTAVGCDNAAPVSASAVSDKSTSAWLPIRQWVTQCSHTQKKNQIWQKLTNIMLMFGLELRAKFVWFILLRQDTTCK